MGVTFVEDTGNTIVPPEQIGLTGLNVGITNGFTVTVIVAVVAH